MQIKLFVPHKNVVNIKDILHMQNNKLILRGLKMQIENEGII